MNKQKTDWEKEFSNKFVKYVNYFKEVLLFGNPTEAKDFISQLLKTQREEIISEIEGIVKENRKGTFTDEGGNDCWYIDDLVKELKILENK